MFAVGFMVAVSIKVGQAIGAGDAELAKRVAALGILTAGAFAVIIATSLYAMRKYVVPAYTSDDRIGSTESALFGPLGLLITLQVVCVCVCVCVVCVCACV